MAHWIWGDLSKYKCSWRAALVIDMVNTKDPPKGAPWIFQNPERPGSRANKESAVLYLMLHRAILECDEATHNH